MNDGSGSWCVFWVIALVCIAIIAECRRRWRRRVLTSYGQAFWAYDALLRAWGLLGNNGLILGRTLTGLLIRLPRYCHVLLTGGTGSGKGIGIIIPNLLDYLLGSVIVFDTKGDLYATTAGRREKAGQQVYWLAPFAPDGSDTWNPLDTIPIGPTLIDSAKAMAEAIVVREGTEPDPYWNAKTAQVIAALLVLVLLKMTGKQRTLNSVQDIASDPELLADAADRLKEMGGVPGRMGSQIKALFDKERMLTKEGASVMGNCARHLSFLDSEMVMRSVASSSFDPRSLLRPGTTLFLTIPPDQLEAQKGLLRCWISTLIRLIGAAGSEDVAECLMLIDEASACGGLAAIEEALVRGRSAGVRLLLAYQSESQVRTAFKDKPTLIYDNCSTRIQMGPPGNYEDAEVLSKSLGDWTQIVDNDADNWGTSLTPGSGGSPGSYTRSRGGSMNRAQQGRALKRPEELLTMGEEFFIALIRGFPAPIIGRRIEWFKDSAFVSSVRRKFSSPTNFWGKCALACCVISLIAIIFLVARAKMYGYGAWAGEGKPAVTQVVETAPEQRGYIGVVLANSFEKADAANLGLDEAEGALVKEANPNTPAWVAGIQPGDVVLEVDGVPVRNKEDLIRLVSCTSPGKRIRLQLWREKGTTFVEMEVGDRTKLQDPLNSKR